MKIHPTAIVDPNAELGEDVTIGPFAIVESDVIIGDGCKIGSSVLLASGARLGKNVSVFHGAAIGSVPQDLKFGGEKTTAEIGDNTVVREYVTVNRGTQAHNKSTVGANCLLMAYCHVAHDCIVGDNSILANSVNLAGHVTIEEFVIIGGIVGIHQFVNIGAHCMIGGMFRVTKDVPPYILAGGTPLRYEGLNSIGLKRRGFTPEQRKAIKDAYRMIYQSDVPRADALRKIKSQGMIPETERIINFFGNSERGVI